MDHINMEMLKLEFTELNQSFNFYDSNSLETTFLPHHHPEFPSCYALDSTGFKTEVPSTISISSFRDDFDTTKPRRVIKERSTTDCSRYISSSGSSSTEVAGENNARKKKKNERGGNNKKDVRKSEEVIHVRAKRGQATDSHSIAERVRREKINKKMKCLQDLVPGCNKAMGMAGMLEEIINYVYSMQNQVQFLSMELATASSSYNLGIESINQLQTIPHEAQQIEEWAREEKKEEMIANFHSTWPF